jgi:hypothetical protein
MGATRRVGRVTKPVPAIVLTPLQQEIVTARCRQLLHYLKRGKPVEFLQVWLTHKNIHAIHRSNDLRARQMRERFPLELVLAKGADMEQRHDASGFTVGWRIDLPKVPAPTPPATYPPDTGDPVRDFHPPHVPPLQVLDDVGPVESESLPSPRGQHEPT